MTRCRWRLPLLLSTALIGGGATAAELKWDGFFTSTYSITNTKSTYRDVVHDDGSFDDSRFGLHVVSDIHPLWRLEAQLFAAGYEDNYAARLDWGFASFHPSERLNLKFGKLKYPNNLVSEYYDVGLAYPWIRPPHEYYSLEEPSASVTYESFNGASAIISRRSGDWDLVAQPFFGEIELAESDAIISRFTGIKLSASNDLTELQASVAQGRMNAAGHELDDQTKRIVSLGVHTEWGSLVNYLEYAVTTFSDSEEARTKAGYITLGYHFGHTMPHITYAGFDQESGWGQQSVTVGVKQMLNPSTALKLEMQRITPELNPEVGAEMASGLFMDDPEKTRVNAFSIAIDVVF